MKCLTKRPNTGAPLWLEVFKFFSIVRINTINYHLKKIFSDSELDENSVIRNFRVTAKDKE